MGADCLKTLLHLNGRRLSRKALAFEWEPIVLKTIVTHNHLTITYSRGFDSSLGKDFYYVRVWNDKTDQYVFHHKCKNEESAKMMFKALELDYKSK